MIKDKLRKCKCIFQESGHDKSSQVFLFHKWVAEIPHSKGEVPRALVEYAEGSHKGRMTMIDRFEVKFID